VCSGLRLLRWGDGCWALDGVNDGDARESRCYMMSQEDCMK
jgi:hypothetical protein